MDQEKSTKNDISHCSKCILLAHLPLLLEISVTVATLNVTIKLQLLPLKTIRQKPQSYTHEDNWIQVQASGNKNVLKKGDKMNKSVIIHKKPCTSNCDSVWATASSFHTKGRSSSVTCSTHPRLPSWPALSKFFCLPLTLNPSFIWNSGFVKFLQLPAQPALVHSHWS